MAELMNEHEQKLFENLMAHNSAYYGYELSKGEIKTILQAFTELRKYRSTTEADIRASVIDELENIFIDKWSGVEDALSCDTFVNILVKVAEQLKG